MKRVLVFQHIAVEHPGIFRDFMAADGVAWDAIELDAGEAIPPLEPYDALIVMGGPMDVFEEDKFPWLIAEKRAIREWVVERRRPYLGLCLGHQLLADALGGEVARMATPEVGMLTVETTEAAKADTLLKGLGPRIDCLQWHGCEVTRLPNESTVLARSPACAVQAFRVGERAYGLQCHVELTERTVAEWGAVPIYADSLEQSCGRGALLRLDEDAKQRLPALASNARRLYDNFKTLVAASATATAQPAKPSRWRTRVGPEPDSH
jgi:GMP synthase-like glutamine amidotransferase